MRHQNKNENQEINHAVVYNMEYALKVAYTIRLCRANKELYQQICDCFEEKYIDLDDTDTITPDIVCEIFRVESINRIFREKYRSNLLNKFKEIIVNAIGENNYRKLKTSNTHRLNRLELIAVVDILFFEKRKLWNKKFVYNTENEESINKLYLYLMEFADNADNKLTRTDVNSVFCKLTNEYGHKLDLNMYYEFIDPVSPNGKDFDAEALREQLANNIDSCISLLKHTEEFVIKWLMELDNADRCRNLMRVLAKIGRGHFSKKQKKNYNTDKFTVAAILKHDYNEDYQTCVNDFKKISGHIDFEIDFNKERILKTIYLIGSCTSRPEFYTIKYEDLSKSTKSKEPPNELYAKIFKNFSDTEKAFADKDLRVLRGKAENLKKYEIIDLDAGGKISNAGVFALYLMFCCKIWKYIKNDYAIINKMINAALNDKKTNIDEAPIMLLYCMIVNCKNISPKDFVIDRLRQTKISGLETGICKYFGVKLIKEYFRVLHNICTDTLRKDAQRDVLISNIRFSNIMNDILVKRFFKLQSIYHKNKSLTEIEKQIKADLTF